jgi:hypothetical protein
MVNLTDNQKTALIIISVIVALPLVLWLVTTIGIQAYCNWAGGDYIVPKAPSGVVVGLGQCEHDIRWESVD